MPDPTTAASHMLPPSDFALLMSERYYVFLSQSLHDLERQVERYRAEQRVIFDQLLDAGLVEPRTGTPVGNLERQMTRRYPNHPYARRRSLSSSRRTPSSLPIHNPSRDVETHTHRRSVNSPILYCQSSDGVLGTRTNPIYVLDDNEIRCGECWSEGRFIGNCN